MHRLFSTDSGAHAGGHWTDPSSRLFRACGRQELRAALTLVDVKNPAHTDAAAPRSCGPSREVTLAGGCNVADSVPRFNDGDDLSQLTEPTTS